MASERNKFQAETMVEKCKQLRLHVRCHLDSCKKHNHPETPEQCEDNDIVLHLMLLTRELEITEKALKDLSRG